MKCTIERLAGVAAVNLANTTWLKGSDPPISTPTYRSLFAVENPGALPIIRGYR